MPHSIHKIMQRRHPHIRKFALNGYRNVLYKLGRGRSVDVARPELQSWPNQ